MDSSTSTARGYVLDDLLIHLLSVNGSDLHIKAGIPPMVRVHGEMEAIPNVPPVTPEDVQDLLFAVMTDKQRKEYEENLELDFAYAVPGHSRFRVNIHKERGAMGAVLRAIPWEILNLDQLKLPEIIGQFADLPRGLVLVTGPTGSGKSTTLAAIIDRANRTRAGHIVTVEDPIEFIHEHRKSVVMQREVGADTESFAAALKHVLRQDPDIILIGEMRDLETISVALTAAETGHLVFGTLHTQSAKDTITRIIDVFPDGSKDQVRTQLASSIQGVICQTLCKTVDGKRQAALEIMTGTSGVRNLIREGKLAQIPGALQAGAAQGMITLNQFLANLVNEHKITLTVAIEKCSDAADLANTLGYADVDQMRAAAEGPSHKKATESGGW